MKNIPLNALRAFTMIYSEGGIRPAARALGISHSSISRHLRELEAWIGTDLIDRTSEGRKLVFTVQGIRLGEAASQTLSELIAVTDSLRERRLSNAVLVDTTPSFATRWLLPRLADFEVAAPWVKVSVVVDQRLRGPSEHGCDLSIRMGQGPWSDHAAIPLMTDQLLPVASARYWKTHGKPSLPEDLYGHRLLHDRDPNAAWQLWRDQNGPKEMDTTQGQRFGSSDLVIRAAEQGLGIALAHGHLVRDSLNNGFLEAALEEHSIKLPTTYWVLSGRQQETEAVTAFLSWLKTLAKVVG